MNSEKHWTVHWDENGWKPKNGLSPYYTPKEYSKEEFDAILNEAKMLGQQVYNSPKLNLK